MEPATLRRKGAIQVSYDVSQNVYSAQVYPLTAPNGSTIIVCGLDTGLRIIWRGGRPFKSDRTASSGKPTTNGVSSSDVMVIDDSDEERPTSKSNAQPAEFAEYYEEVDPDKPYETFLSTLDVPLSSVTSLSFPHVPSNLMQLPDGAYPSIFSERIVIAAVCKDFSVLVATLPLSPPSPAAKNSSDVGIQIVKLAGHHDLPASVSITHTSDEIELPPRSTSRTRGRQAEEEAVENKEWSLLIASTSPTSGGMLLVHEVGIVQNVLQTEGSRPIQRQSLRSGTGCKIRFNPSVSPSIRHSNLFIIYPSGILKVYQCIQESGGRHPRSRRGSSGTMDSTASKASSQVSGGKFLVTLYAPLVQDTDAALPKRKRLLDACWILGGAAILALLEDGSWGIWDVEGVAAESSIKSQNLIQGQVHQTLLNGRSLTHLLIRGRFTSVGEQKTTEKDAKAKPPKLAPMTPHTRKIRSDGLFTRSSGSIGAIGPGPVAKGGISLIPLNIRAPSSDESVLLFYGKRTVYIPSLPSFIRNTSMTKSDTDAFERPSIARPIPINTLSSSLDLPQTSVSQLPPSHVSAVANQPTLAFAANPSIPDIFITTPRHLIFLCRPIEEPEPEMESENPNQDGVSFEAESNHRPTLDFTVEEDQLLLMQGELDIDGMGRILDGMNKRGGATIDGTPTKQRAISAGRINDNGRRLKIANGGR